MLIVFILTAYCSTSQISLQPNGSGLYCTDSTGVREIARLFKELEYSREEILLYEDLIQALEMEANAYANMNKAADSLNLELVQENTALTGDKESLKIQRWYFGGAGFLLGILLVLL